VLPEMEACFFIDLEDYAYLVERQTSV